MLFIPCPGITHLHILNVFCHSHNKEIINVCAPDLSATLLHAIKCNFHFYKLFPVFKQGIVHVSIHDFHDYHVIIIDKYKRNM